MNGVIPLVNSRTLGQFPLAAIIVMSMIVGGCTTDTLGRGAQDGDTPSPALGRGARGPVTGNGLSEAVGIDIDEDRPFGAHATVAIPSGPGARGFTFKAPDPSSHSYVVAVQATEDAELDLWLTSADGMRLDVYQGALGDSDACERSMAGWSCRWNFPTLPARQDGEWTFNVVGTGEVQLEVEVTFSSD